MGCGWRGEGVRRQLCLSGAGEAGETPGNDDITCGPVMLPRYFQCPPKFGLFAPIHKVIRIGFPSTSPAKAKKTKRMAMGVSALTHSPSSSSISSVSSVASSVGGRPSRSGLVRVELGSWRTLMLRVEGGTPACFDSRHPSGRGGDRGSAISS